jgi:osmotically-inducible protein OsmY
MRNRYLEDTQRYSGQRGESRSPYESSRPGRGQRGQDFGDDRGWSGPGGMDERGWRGDDEETGERGDWMRRNEGWSNYEGGPAESRTWRESGGQFEGRGGQFEDWRGGRRESFGPSGGGGRYQDRDEYGDQGRGRGQSGSGSWGGSQYGSRQFAGGPYGGGQYGQQQGRQYGQQYGGQYGQQYGGGQRGRQSDSSDFGGGAYPGSAEWGGRSGGGWRGETSSPRSFTGRHAGKGPKGYTRSDDRIREDISDALMADGEIDASEIEVQVRSGEITLNGSVESREMKRQVEDLVESIPGVRNVQNSLRVQSGSPEMQDSGANRSQETGSAAGATGETRNKSAETTAKHR